MEKVVMKVSESDRIIVKDTTDRGGDYREICREPPFHVVEYPPQVRVCKFLVHHQAFHHLLAFPYMQFTRFLGKQGLSLHVSFTNQPLENIEQDVYFPPLPNVWWPSLQVCLMRCPSTSFHAVMRDFWFTRYLDCEDWYCFPVLDKELPMRSYKGWERMTRERPEFILEVNWTHPAKITEIPHYDSGGSKSHGQSAKPEYGGTSVNRKDGPIRNFAVVNYRKGGGCSSTSFDDPAIPKVRPEPSPDPPF